MYVAGPIQSADEARMLEQAAYLTDLRNRTHPLRRRAAGLEPQAAPTRPSLFTH